MTTMRKKRRFEILLAILLFGAAACAMAQAKYVAAQVAAADNFMPPWNSTASGIVVLSVSLDATGAVVGVDARRDLPPVTNSAKSAVQSWQFKPASAGSDPQPSELLAIFVVPPAVSFPTYPRFRSLPPEAGSISGAVPGQQRRIGFRCHSGHSRCKWQSHRMADRSCSRSVHALRSGCRQEMELSRSHPRRPASCFQNRHRLYLPAASHHAIAPGLSGAYGHRIFEEAQ
jgi:hypothetical protein